MFDSMLKCLPNSALCWKLAIGHINLNYVVGIIHNCEQSKSNTTVCIVSSELNLNIVFRLHWYYRTCPRSDNGAATFSPISRWNINQSRKFVDVYLISNYRWLVNTSSLNIESVANIATYESNYMENFNQFSKSTMLTLFRQSIPNHSVDVWPITIGAPIIYGSLHSA